VINGWTVTYCVECGQSFRRSDVHEAVPYDDSTRQEFQEIHRQKIQRTVKKSVYLLTGVIVLILLALIFAPLSSSTINIEVNPASLTQKEHYQVLIDGGFVGEGDIAPGSLVIWTVPYHYPWAFSGQHHVTVQGIVDGVPGNHGDTHSFTIVDGNTYTVTLNL
jgi:hypothetical protein